MEAVLRMKCVVGAVKKSVDNEGNPYQEEVVLNAVCSDKEGSANKQWCKWTPCVNFTFTISNPQAFAKVLPGQFMFVDLIPTDKDSL